MSTPLGNLPTAESFPLPTTPYTKEQIETLSLIVDNQLLRALSLDPGIYTQGYGEDAFKVESGSGRVASIFAGKAVIPIVLDNIEGGCFVEQLAEETFEFEANTTSTLFIQFVREEGVDSHVQAAAVLVSSPTTTLDNALPLADVTTNSSSITGIIDRRQFARSARALIDKGEYDSTTTYAKSDMVRVGSASYVSLVSDNTGNDPATSPDEWHPMGGGAGGGHTILNGAGTSLPQRGNLQFTGDSVATSDNAGGNKTVATFNHKADAVHTVAQPVEIRADGVAVGTRRVVDFVTGDNADILIEDDTENEVVVITISSVAGGTTWRKGTGAPSNTLGVNGDFYIDDATYNVYVKSGGAYTVAFNIKGATGDTGTGAVWRDGAGAPNDAVGADGDYYFNNTSGEIFKRVGGVYELVAQFALGDMAKATYDANNDGVVDNAAQLNGQAPSYYLARTNHTGTQPTSSITGLDTALAALTADVAAAQTAADNAQGDVDTLATTVADHETRIGALEDGGTGTGLADWQADTLESLGTSPAAATALESVVPVYGSDGEISGYVPHFSSDLILRNIFDYTTGGRALGIHSAPFFISGSIGGLHALDTTSIGINVTLPPASTHHGGPIRFKWVAGANNITIQPDSDDAIDNLAEGAAYSFAANGHAVGDTVTLCAKYSAIPGGLSGWYLVREGSGTAGAGGGNSYVEIDATSLTSPHTLTSEQRASAIGIGGTRATALELVSDVGLASTIINKCGQDVRFKPSSASVKWETILSGGASHVVTDLTDVWAVPMVKRLFSPASYSDLGLWLRADSITGITSGGSVPAWSDESGNSDVYANASSSDQPLWVSNVLKGQPEVRATNAQRLYSSTATPFQGGVQTIFLVARLYKPSSEFFLIDTATDSALSRRYFLCRSTGLFFGRDGSGGGITNADYTSGQYRWVKIVSNGSSSSITIQGGTPVTGTISDNSADSGTPISMGHHYSGFGTNSETRSILEFIVYNRLLTTDESDNVAQYLTDKYF